MHAHCFRMVPLRTCFHSSAIQVPHTDQPSDGSGWACQSPEVQDEQHYLASGACASYSYTHYPSIIYSPSVLACHLLLFQP